jgi:protein SCO1
MSQRVLSSLIIMLAAAAIGLALFWKPIAPALPPPPADGDFTLQSASGPLDTHSLRGKVLLVYFGYTYCPDICPTALVNIGQALKQLTPEEAGQVQVIFVSVDPERDTPERLKSYVEFFHPGIVGVTGKPDEIARAAQQYGAIYARQDVGSQAGYVVDHSAWTYVVAADGHQAGRLAHGSTPQQIAAEIRKSLPSPAMKGTP